MTVFRKIEEADPTKIVVELSEADGQVFGHVAYATSWSPDDIKIQVTDNPNLPGEEAVRAAVEMASKLGQDVFVLDKGNAWHPEWGQLLI